MHDCKSTKKHAFHTNSFSLEVTVVKLEVRKYLDIVCEIQRAIFVRQLAMFLNGDKMMKLFKLRLHLFKKRIKMVQKDEGNQACRIYIYPL